MSNSNTIIGPYHAIYLPGPNILIYNKNIISLLTTDFLLTKKKWM